MKFSNRERLIIAILKQRKEREFELDDIINDLKSTRRKGTRNFRPSVIQTMKNLSAKLEIFGIELEVLPRIGRSQKAAYRVSGKLQKFQP